MKGSLGLQVIRTRQASTGTISNFDPATFTVTVLPVSGSATYTNFLPSATMSVELIPGGYVKLGASQTMVRPRLDQERINQDFSVSPGNIGNPANLNSPFSSTGGNVNLRPYQSSIIDASFEKYFSGGGCIALSVYFKHLTSFVDPNNSLPFDFTAALSQLSPAQRAIVVANGWTTGLSSSPANTGRGYLIGMEATLSLPFKTISSALV